MSKGRKTLLSFKLNFFTGLGMSSGCGIHWPARHCLHVLAVISAWATRLASMGSKGRGCRERHCLQMPKEPNLHHCSTKVARLDVVALGNPASFPAMSSAWGVGRPLSKKNFFSTRFLSALRRFLYAVTSLLPRLLKARLRSTRAAFQASAVASCCTDASALRGCLFCFGSPRFSFNASVWNLSLHSSGTLISAAL